MSLISLNLPKSDGNFQDHQTLGNLVGYSDTLAISQAARAFYGLTVVVTPDTRTALRLEKALPQFAGLPVQLFPDWETLPYDNFSPHQDIISARLSALFELQQGRQQILLLPINTLMQKVCPPNYLANNVLLIKKGDRFSIQKLRLQLENAGYRAVGQVLEYGEYAVRGSILDLFPMGAEEPFRLDFSMMRSTVSALLMWITNAPKRKLPKLIYCRHTSSRLIATGSSILESNSVKNSVKSAVSQSIFISKSAKAF